MGVPKILDFKTVREVKKCEELRSTRLCVLIMSYSGGKTVEIPDCKIQIRETGSHSWFGQYFCSNIYGPPPRVPRGVKKSAFFSNKTVVYFQNGKKKKKKKKK